MQRMLRKSRPTTRPHRRPRGRRWAWIAVAIALAVVAKPLLLPPSASQPWERITVQPGDTLWRVAEQRATAADDIRLIVRAIKQANGLEASTIRPGDVLLVPPVPPERGGHLQ